MPLACETHDTPSPRRAAAGGPCRLGRNAPSEHSAVDVRRPERGGLFLALRTADHLSAAGSGLRMRSRVRDEHRWHGPPSRVEREGPYDVRLLLRRRPPDLLRDHAARG